MPKQVRHKTRYPGVYWIEGTGANGKPEKIFYIVYRKKGKLIEEKAGRHRQDEMTPARAARLRAQRMEGKELPNKIKRELERKRREKEQARWTIERLWEEYYNLRPKTKGILTDKGRYEKYLRDDFGHKEPQEILPLDVDRLRHGLSKKLAPQTVKHVLGILKRIVNFGVNRGLCEQLRFKIKMPTVNNVKTEFLGPEELGNLIKAIEEDHHPYAGKIMLMALYTGMRRGEIFKLKWEDVDFEQGFIHIRNPKGGKDQIIPLSSTTRSLLQELPRSSKYVFPGQTSNKPIQNIYPALRRIKQKAGLPEDFRVLHGLRHTYASLLASTGKVDMYTLQKLLTHKTPTMTQRYAHLRDEALKKAGSMIDDLIPTPGSKKVVSLGQK